MRLYYTNISIQDGEQKQPHLSLGGFISSTVVPNNSYSNIFGDISCYSVAENKEEYAVIALKNETGVEATNVTIYITYPENCQQKIELAFVAFNANGEMEIVNSQYDAPYNAEFHDVEGIENAVNIGNISIDGYIGIWFKRIIDVAAYTDQYSDESLAANGNPLEADENIVLSIIYNE